ncbi:unnamed protein product [Orchesella dallaii]|uniref:Kinesin-like protein n=1 Tax=Orchesella dallaii TaxID=48710 RepID=A0ABP1QS65_9HEXA
MDKKTTRPPTTPASNRRIGPPSSATRSAGRPATAGALRYNPDLNRQLNLNLRESDPVEVYCRIKPLEGDGDDSCIRILDDSTLALIPPETSAAWKLGNAKEQHYTFQRVFGSDASQKVIFDSIALPLVKDFLQGKNALLFAYGVTGSGKTFTMSGNSSESGVMPRCLDVVFNSIAKNRASKYVFRPDRMNGFESQTKADAMLERQKEMHERQRETAKTPRRNGRPPIAEYGIDQYMNRVRDETSLPVGNEDSLYSVFVTYIEIYNNSVYDLLDESPIDIMKTRGALQHKLLREDYNHNVYVNGVAEVEVESPEEAFEVYLKGQRRRRMAHTALNTESSRSHSIFNIRLVQAPLDPEGEEIMDNSKMINVSQLSLVDLAGSERYHRTQARGDRLKEAGNINNSLMTLRKCMDILRENQKFSANRVVPYRESKLTHFLKNYFDGEGRVRMILCVNPRNDDYDENLHVMAFAELTQEIQIVRPQEPKKFEPMTPGRHKANELYKEAKRQLVEEKIVEENELPSSDVQLVFGLGIPIPLCKISKSTEEEALSTLRKALELRLKGKEELQKFIVEKRQSFRLRLVGIEREMLTLRSENSNLRSHIERVTTEKEKLDNIFRATLFEKGELETKYKEQEAHIHQLEEELLNCKMELRQRDLAHHKEKENLKSDMDLQRELDAMKQERNLQNEKAKLEAEFRTKEKTIIAVRELVSNIDAPRSSRSRQSKSKSSKSAALLELSTTSSESDLPSAVSKADRITRSKFMSTPVLHESVVIPSSANRRSALVNNPRYGRARSTDRDVWIEHTDKAVVLKPQTVFQPVMKKKKSVTQLKSADDMKGASKYCLLTQEPDSEGDIETRLYKGEINRTITGGANMVLQDVEALRQTSPKPTPSRKRTSSSPSGPEIHRPRFDRGLETHYDEVEKRCRVGVSYRDSETTRNGRK